MGDAEPGAHRAKGTLKAFTDIGAGTVVSRLSGFAREVLLAAFFGAGTSVDIFVAAFTIPNLVCRILGEGALEASFLPLFKGLHAKGETRRAWRLVAETTNNLALILTVLVVVGMIAAPLLVSVVAHGFTGDVADSAIRMTRLMFPFGLVIGLAALMGSVLLAFRRYLIYSLAPVLFNVGIIMGLVLFFERLGVVSLGIGVLLGGLLQFLVQVPPVRRLARADGARVFGRGLGLADRDLHHVARLAGPAIVASAIQRVGAVVDRTIASFLVPGSISSLYYSFRIVHLPYAIIALAAGRSVAPLLAEQHALGRSDDFRDTLLSGLRMNMLFLTPVVLLSVWFAREIVGVIYQRGAFDETDLTMTSAAFAYYAIGLVSMGVVFVLTRAFAARLDTKTPVKVALGAFFANVVLNLLLVRTPLKHAGLALASSLAYTVHAVVLYLIMNRALARTGSGIAPRDLLRPAAKLLLAGVALLAVVSALDPLLGMTLAQHTLLNRLLRMILGGGAAGAAYLVCAHLLRMNEVALLFTRDRRRGL